jgi:1,4-dihydroxy-6-naphthoate synthase
VVSALGQGVGPLLISNPNNIDAAARVNENTIAIPGQHTTAHLLFSLAYPGAVKQNIFCGTMKSKILCWRIKDWA